jgi:hypothetical protein
MPTHFAPTDNPTTFSMASTKNNSKVHFNQGGPTKAKKLPAPTPSSSDQQTPSVAPATRKAAAKKKGR